MTHIQQPLHLSWATKVVPFSASRCIAPDGHAIKQVASWQWRHWSGKLDPFGPKTPTRAAGLGSSRTASASLLLTEFRSTAHCNSQVLQPRHFSLSTHTRFILFLHS
jgi:hypothetical protein